MLNPRTPFVYREAEEMEPFVYARFGTSLSIVAVINARLLVQ